MFPDLEAKINEARRKQDPSVPTLLGMLSKAVHEYYIGHEDKADDIVLQALKE